MKINRISNENREKIINLRKNGMRLCDISLEMNISKTTVYHWIKNIPLRNGVKIERTDKQKKSQKKAVIAIKEKYSKIRDKYYEDGKSDYNILINDPTFIDFICLYIGEGSKCRCSPTITNCDPLVIKIGYYWLNRLSKRKPVLSVYIYGNNDFDKTNEFWTQLFDNNVEVRVYRKKNYKAKRNRILPFGTANIRVHDVCLMQKIKCWMDIRKDIYRNTQA